jgi:hypothetical protein
MPRLHALSANQNDAERGQRRLTFFAAHPLLVQPGADVPKEGGCGRDCMLMNPIWAPGADWF